jgi:hypothetical protein
LSLNSNEASVHIAYLRCALGAGRILRLAAFALWRDVLLDEAGAVVV